MHFPHLGTVSCKALSCLRLQGSSRGWHLAHLHMQILLKTSPAAPLASSGPAKLWPRWSLPACQTAKHVTCLYPEVHLTVHCSHLRCVVRRALHLPCKSEGWVLAQLCHCLPSRRSAGVPLTQSLLSSRSRCESAQLTPQMRTPLAATWTCPLHTSLWLSHAEQELKKLLLCTGRRRCWRAATGLASVRDLC